MPAKEPTKFDLEFTLERVEFPSRKRLLHTDHAIDARLIWPRVGIAQKSAQSAITLRNGVWNGTEEPWTSRILFKESCEGNFGLQINVSVSVTRTWLRSFRRTMLGYVTKSAGEYVDNFGPLGELAEAPLKVVSKDLLASKAPELLATGVIDLNALQFSSTPETEITIPLFAELAVSKVKKHLAAATRQIGSAVVKIRP